MSDQVSSSCSQSLSCLAQDPANNHEPAPAPPKAAPKKSVQTREERRKQALKANMARRKAQSKARALGQKDIV